VRTKSDVFHVFHRVEILKRESVFAIMTSDAGLEIISVFGSELGKISPSFNRDLVHENPPPLAKELSA
jgi:hypothetical protein